MTSEADIGVCEDLAISILEDAAFNDETIALHSLLQGLNKQFPDGQIFQARDVFNVWFSGIATPNNGVSQIIDGIGAIFGSKKDITSTSFGKVLQNRKGRLAGGLKLLSKGRDRNKVTNWVIAKG